MCGRFALVTNKDHLAQEFNAASSSLNSNYISYNIIPTNIVPIIHLNQYNKAVISMMKWGLIPIWTKLNHEENKNLYPINARFESLEQKISFREAYKSRRCLIPASGFYEWDKNSSPKQPYYFFKSNDEIIAFAGIWNSSIIEGNTIYSFAIITKNANQQIADIHERMPLIIDNNSYDLWLRNGEVNLTPKDLQFYQIGNDVNNPKNNSESLINKLQ